MIFKYIILRATKRNFSHQQIKLSKRRQIINELEKGNKLWNRQFCLQAPRQ